MPQVFIYSLTLELGGSRDIGDYTIGDVPNYHLIKDDGAHHKQTIEEFMTEINAGMDTADRIFAYEIVEDPCPGWSIGDVKQQAFEDGVGLTDAQALEVLQFAAMHMDANVGINWDSLSFAITQVVTYFSEKVPLSLEEYARSIRIEVNEQEDLVHVIEVASGDTIYCADCMGLDKDPDQYFGYEDKHGSWDINIYKLEDEKLWKSEIYIVDTEIRQRTGDPERLTVIKI